MQRTAKETRKERKIGVVFEKERKSSQCEEISTYIREQQRGR